ncbi:fungal-specific transcription factor domain-containing protein [Lipomyces orientalis]|uniref:Fungal-specific transcription factor domain-containing protein n=1 Tax=Lipomyces orientalis TaxID=1233043 RepID=A0ACC3TEL3_9ASCO
MFAVLTGLSKERSESSGPSATKKRKKVNASLRACSECKRRKVKCTGDQPCESCVWYKCQDKCIYPNPALQVRAKQEDLATASTSLNEYSKLVCKLFPSSTIEALSSLTKDQLLKALLNEHNVDIGNTGHSHPALSHGSQEQSDASGADHDAILESLSNDRVDEFGWTELDSNDKNPVADDVNALAMSSAGKTSYVGVMSVSTALRVIAKLSTTACALSTRKMANGALHPLEDRSNFNHQECAEDLTSLSYQNSLKLVNAYFDKVHPLVPIVHETTFRANFASKETPSSSWLALLYMVLCLGSIATTKADNLDHFKYFKAARHFCNLDSLGSGNLEIVQVLILMSGVYLHYRNCPNSAVTLSGAAIRMSYGLCLHRDLPHSQEKKIGFIHNEIRRRTWWTLYCMDVIGVAPLGRPTFHDSSSGITISLPSNFDENVNTPVIGWITDYSCLRSETALCRILTKVERLMLMSDVPSPSEIEALDSELVGWHQALPNYIKENSESRYHIACSTLRWRYQNIRILLSRSTLLNAMLKRNSTNSLPLDIKAIVMQCRNLAKETISDISANWLPNQLSCWSAVWNIFQASLIPLLSLYSEDRSQKDWVEDWRNQIETALIALEKMTPWRTTAEQSANLIRTLLVESNNMPDVRPLFPEWITDEEQLWQEIIYGWNTRQLYPDDDFLCN